MGCSYLYLYAFAVLSCCFHLIILTNSSSSSAQPLCREDESFALLQLKRSFTINKFASSDPSAHPKLESWKLHGNTSDCCSWDGVECDRDTGHVIGLDLSSSFLYGSINSNSTLFSLLYILRLNLADNHFNFSQIPPRIGYLSRLTSLNLSRAAFFGQVPSEISDLFYLNSLDLSNNFNSGYGRFLELQNPSLRNLVQNLTNLKELDLNAVYIPTTIPDILTNMTSLTSLGIAYCGLQGEFPRNIFLLPNLRILRAGSNQNLTGSLPEFHSISRLEFLELGRTSFYGELPDSIGKLQSLNYLDLSGSNFSGILPSSLGNLTQLTVLALRFNNFRGEIPYSLSNLSQLTYFALGENSFDGGTDSFPFGHLPKLTTLIFTGMKMHGELPRSLSNLTQLSYLVLSNNSLVGKIPSWLMNLTQLTTLELVYNQLHGTIPSSISQLKQLDFLNLGANSLSGRVELDIFMKLPNLASLQLSLNKLTVLTKTVTNVTFPKFRVLGLASCNLSEFPGFLQFQDELEVLLFSDNKIHGKIPTWVWNSSKETMEVVQLNQNFLTGFDQNPTVIPWNSLKLLDLSSNMLQGSLPVPSPTTVIYKVTGNLLTGEIPASICHKSSLSMLDLSANNLSGTIPPCLITSSDDLLVLNLSRNSFQGSIPPTFLTNSKLMMIDLSQNQLQGQVPRSLENCKMLEILVLGNNRIEDIFPSWLGALPELQVLVLRSNKLHGFIENPKTNSVFPKLHIIDLSHNGFSGNLPSEYFQKLNAMKTTNVKNFAYMQAISRYEYLISAGPTSHMSTFWSSSWDYSYSITIANKGTQRLYEKIQNAFVAVDLSNNEFSGKIPESLGSLGVLQMINMSSNNLTGVIPSSLANLTELESLDLSQNLLSGEIPQQLTQLTFLSILNVSHNHLTGPIPRGKQFETFENSSYVGNEGLCGDPLSKSCENSEASPPPPPRNFDGNESEFLSGLDWMVISIGYGSGLIVGLVIGHTLTRRYHGWFVATFGRGKRTRRREKRTRQRS